MVVAEASKTEVTKDEEAKPKIPKKKAAEKVKKEKKDVVAEKPKPKEEKPVEEIKPRAKKVKVAAAKKEKTSAEPTLDMAILNPVVAFTEQPPTKPDYSIFVPDKVIPRFEKRYAGPVGDPKSSLSGRHDVVFKRMVDSPSESVKRHCYQFLPEDQKEIRGAALDRYESIYSFLVLGYTF